MPEILHFAECASRLQRCGIGTAVSNQRKALQETDVTVYTSFSEIRTSKRDLMSGEIGRTIDAIHLNFAGPVSYALARYDTQTPVVAHTHVTAEDFAQSFRFSGILSPVVRRYLSRFYDAVDLLICPSKHAERRIQSYTETTPTRVVTNGVDTATLRDYEGLHQEYRRRYNLTGTVVFTLGNVFERKGLSRFLETARRLPKHEFVWFGPYETGPQASASVRSALATHPDNVTFTGWIDDKRGAFGAGDIFFSPTTEENQGIATLEAMACQKPTVLSDIPVFRDLYTHEKDCLVGSSVDEFAEAIERLSTTTSLEQQLGHNAAKTAESHSLQRVADGLLDCYTHARTE